MSSYVYNSPSKPPRIIGQWIGFYTAERLHSALGGRTPAEVYRGDPPVDMLDTPLRASAHRQQHTGTTTKAPGTRRHMINHRNTPSISRQPIRQTGAT